MSLYKFLQYFCKLDATKKGTPYLLGSLGVEARPAHNKPECTNR